jgi:hypothetical protein
MPKYTYRCECGNVATKYAPKEKETIRCSKCRKDMIRDMPVLNGPCDKKELINPFLNHKRIDNQDAIIDARKQKHYWSIEVPKMVNSGVYGIDTMLEKGWIYFDDNMHMHIHTKPPSER